MYDPGKTTLKEAQIEMKTILDHINSVFLYVFKHKHEKKKLFVNLAVVI